MAPTARARPRRRADRAGRGRGARPRPPPPRREPDAATLYCYVGGLTNLAIGVGQSCVFNRVLQNGVESMAATLAERRGLTLDHSASGCATSASTREIDGLEGEREIIEEAREVLSHGARRIADEIRLSIEYYHTTVPDARRVETTVMAGPGIAIEGLAAFFEQELGMPVQPRSMGQVEVRPGRARRRRGGRADRRHRPRPGRGAGVRPINLIPVEQRRGAARGPRRTSRRRRVRAARRPRRRRRVRAGVRAAVELHQQQDRRSSPTLQAQAQGEKQVADALRPVRAVRRHAAGPPPADQPRSRTGRFDWERALRQLSLAIPRNVYLLNVAATGSPEVEIEGGGGGGDLVEHARQGDAPGVRDDRLHVLAARRRADDDAHAQPRRRDRGDASRSRRARRTRPRPAAPP